MPSLAFDSGKFREAFESKASKRVWSPEEVFGLLKAGESSEEVISAIHRKTTGDKPKAIVQAIKERLAYSLKHFDGRYETISPETAAVVWAWLQGKEAPHRWTVAEYTRGVLDLLRDYAGIGDIRPPFQTFDKHWSWVSRDGVEHRFHRQYDCHKTGRVKITYRGNELGWAEDQWKAPEVILEFIRRHGML